ncbi:MAG TPA: hypothetical protein VEZ51_02435 [Gemmatimonadaceae bacterium]|nr:hypothetical protein [Gemmatimonadaceae bacterium]
MKFLTIALALSGVASAGSLGAQVVLPVRTGTVATQRRNDCSYVRTTNTVGDIIFGRANVATNCRDVYSREDGAWYQVGRGRDNNSIYERRVRNANGTLVIQRARRNPDGTFTIFSTRTATTNDKQWKKAQKEQHKAWKKQEKAEDKQTKDQLSKGDYKDWKKQEKAENKAIDANFKASMKSNKGKNK